MMGGRKGRFGGSQVLVGSVPAQLGSVQAEIPLGHQKQRHDRNWSWRDVIGAHHLGALHLLFVDTINNQSYL